MHTHINQRTFDHLLIQKPAPTQRLHVYIEGDGVPYPTRFQIAVDPSPTQPLMLQLMQYDRHFSIYLGRPCYFTEALDELTGANCTAHDWTDARYSDAIITSMASALRIFLAQHPAHGVTLIGHSGGGTIATLMAARMPEVDQLVTLAANLDTAAWTRYHHYSPLKKSLNPAEEIQHLDIAQLHFSGARDTNIPSVLAKKFLDRTGQAFILLADADHNCCWLGYWPRILTEIERQAP